MKKKKAFFVPAILAIALGIFSNLPFDFIGTLRVSELISGGCLVCMLASKTLYRTLKISIVKKFLLAVICWICIQLISDFYNKTALLDIYKGHANLILVASSFLLFAILFRDRIQIVIVYWIAKSIGSLLFGTLIQTSEEIMANEYWDLRVGFWAGPLVLAGTILFSRKMRMPVILGLILYSACAITFGGRSHGLPFACAALALIMTSPKMRSRFSNISRKQTIRVIAVAAISLCLLFPTYVYFGLQGLITKKAEEQLEMLETPYNPIEVLLSARYGIKYGLTAISRRPIAGYGSRAYSGDYLPLSAIHRNFNNNFIHSMYFEAWAFGGIGCGFCFSLILFWVLRHCISIISIPDNRCIFVASYVAVLLLWASLASPLASFRIVWPAAFAMLLAFDSRISSKPAVSVVRK